jgi:transposase
MFQAELVQIYQGILLGLGNGIERVARTNNHTVLFTPPRKSEWQPIEKYWAVVKNDVARKYSKNRTFPQVRQQLESAMDHFGSGSANHRTSWPGLYGNRR